MSKKKEEIEEVEDEEIEESTEEDSEASTEQDSVEPVSKPKSEPSKDQAICSVCGDLVYPTVIHTDRGDRHKCPSCKKFMRPMTPEEAQSRDAALETEMVEDSVLLPPDVIVLNRVKAELSARLPSIYGIPVTNKKAVVAAVVDTITKNEISDPRLLHAHIKGFAKNINDKHLEALIGSIYGILDQEGYGGTGEGYTPRYDGIGIFGDGRRDRYGTLRRDMGLSDQHAEGQTGQPREMVMMIDGYPIKTTDPQTYLAWKNSKREEEVAGQKAEAHKMKMMELEADMKGKSSSGDKVEIPNPKGDGTITVPVALVPLFMKSDDSEHKKELAEERERTEKAREEASAAREQRLIDIVEGLSQRPSVLEEIERAKAMGASLGMQHGGRTTMDIFSEGVASIDNRIGQALDRMQPGSEGFEPEVTRTQAERKDKAKEILEGIEKSADVLEAEDGLLAAVTSLKKED